MEKWALTIVAAEWNGTGFDYEQIIENTETNVSEWDTYEFGNTTYHESMWESDAAKFALGV